MAERETVRSQILSTARTLTGAEQDEEMLLQRICLAQEAQLARALREGVKQENCEDACICAAAWLAAAALESARAGGEELSSLRAGDMSVTKRAAADAARRLDALRAQAWALMRPYTKDGGFYFCRTQG